MRLANKKKRVLFIPNMKRRERTYIANRKDSLQKKGLLRSLVVKLFASIQKKYRTNIEKNKTRMTTSIYLSKKIFKKRYIVK